MRLTQQQAYRINRKSHLQMCISIKVKWSELQFPITNCITKCISDYESIFRPARISVEYNHPIATCIYMNQLSRDVIVFCEAG